MMKHDMLKTSLFLFAWLNMSLFADAYEGNVLFTPLASSYENATTYLMNNDEEILQSWNHEQGPASMPYLLTDGSIIYPYRVPFPSMEAGGVGGGIQCQSWNGELLWEHEFANETYQHHHDVEPLPNGNVLLIVWEKKTAQEAYDMGREVIDNPLNQMWSFAILELNPITGNIDWEWHIWDHLIQDVDPELPNFGIISEHPELFDINCGDVGNNAGGPQGANGDWMHINAIDHNPHLDQIAISSRLQDEIFIIDHSTTTEEAASHSGGNSGMGGDFLYRWGNPQNYGRGTEEDKILNDQHGINWIDVDFPGGGNLLIYNNLHFMGEENHSAVLEIIPPLDDNGNYSISNGMPHGPEEIEWLYGGDIQTPMQGGAFRLPNGNTIITQTHESRMVEIDMDGNHVWEYQHEVEFGNCWIARAQKYAPDYLNMNPLGDMNEDGSLNVLDIVILANLILNDEFDFSGDLNQDDMLNVLDIVLLVGVILGT